MSTKLVFATEQSAIEYLESKDWLENNQDGTFSTRSVYNCESWESSRPDFTVKKFHDGYGIYKQYHSFAGGLNVPSDHRCNRADMGELITCLADLED